MNAFDSHSWTPSPELLAAYADGELDFQDALRCRVEAWLVCHPAAAADLEAQAELSRLMAATTPVEPALAQWDRMLTRIEKRPQPGRRWAAVLWFAGLAAASAAMVVAAVWVQRPDGQQVKPQASGGPPAAIVEGGGAPEAVPLPKPPEIEVLQVATADEVEILQIAGADTGTLLVGRLPLSGPLELLAPHEVEVQRPMHDGSGTEFRMGGGGSTPMFWTPLPHQNDDNDDDVLREEQRP